VIEAIAIFRRVFTEFEGVMLWCKSELYLKRKV
jgi:hypothetical protein